MALRIKTIINPSSGRQTIQHMLDEIIGYLLEAQAIERLDLCYTQSAKDAWNAAAELKKDEYDFVWGIGGDGTINEIVNGLMEGGSQTPLAILPAGTVNDFATFIALPTDSYYYAQMLMEQHKLAVDVGLAGERYFLNVAAGGLLTDIGYKVPVQAKTALGRTAYLLEGAKSLPGTVLSGVNIKCSSKEQTFEGEVLLFLVANTSQVGGFKKLAPSAQVTDGLLDVLIVSKLAPNHVLPLLGQYLIKDHLSNQNIIYFQTDCLHLESSAPLQLDLDGEAADSLPLTVRCFPQALTLLVPKSQAEMLAR